MPYAALDLDWLTWCNVGDGDRASEHAMLLHNLGAVVANYRAGGVRYFVLARWIRDRDELAGLIATMAMPLDTVELVVPLDESRGALGQIRWPDGKTTLPSRSRGASAPRNKRRFESAAIALPPASIASRIRSVAVHEQ